ncbi:hypothetical protein LI221_09970 [Faecalimonas umbilicata]|nr:hypothetical protein [Faecalimonas umbilicata]
MKAEVIEKGILLTFDELRILLYGMGVREIEGIYMPEKTFQKEEILFAMHHMAEAGFIEAGEEKFRVREDVRTLLETMAYPEQTEIFHPGGSEGPAFFLYEKEETVVVSQQFFQKKDTLRLSVFGRKEFEQWREEIVNDYRRD